MRKKLIDLASIHLGYSFRSRIINEKEGSISVIQMKDVSEKNILSNQSQNFSKILSDDIKEHHLVQRNDIIFRSRGTSTTAAIISEDIGVATVAAPLLKIRVASDQIIPEYLCWYINNRLSQAFFASRAKGTFQKMITKNSLEELEINLPSLEKQKVIIDLARLEGKEESLLKRLADKRKYYLEEQLLNAIKER